MNTLFSRRSTLKAWGEPTATVATGSATSITVRWFIAVCTRTTRSRDGVSLSIFCAGSGGRTSATASNPTNICLTAFYSLAKTPRGPLLKCLPRGSWLLFWLRSLKRPGFPRANRGALEERFLLTVGVKLPNARRIPVHEHRKARAESFFAARQNLAPLLAGAERGRPAIAYG